MLELKKEIEITLNFIEMLGEVLASGVTVTKEELTNTITSGILKVFPEIVDVYLKLGENEYKEEIKYWAGQLERILGAVKGNDQFFLLDVLCYETKETLMDFIDHVCIE